MSRSKLFIFILSLSVVVSCSTKKNSTDDGTDTSMDAVTASAKSVSEEAADAISENGSSAMTLMSESNPIEAQSVSIDRTCTAGTNNVVVAEIFTGTDSKTFSRTIGNRTLDITASITMTGTETRTWTPPSGQTLTCNSASQRVRINWTDDSVVTGLTLGTTLNRKIAMSKTLQITRNGSTTSKTKTDDVEVSGARTNVWISQSTSNGIVSRSKVVTSLVSRKRTYTKLNGDTGVVTSELETKDGASLQVVVQRNTTDGSLVQKTISSGTVVATNSDGVKTECSFSNVVYDLSSTNTNKCVPTSGSITCLVYDSGATSSSKTLLITFGEATESTVTLSVDSGEAEDFSDYNTSGCDLENAS